MYAYLSDPADATVPRSSLHSITSGDVATPTGDEGAEPGDNESVFDEEGILFGDSEFETNQFHHLLLLIIPSSLPPASCDDPLGSRGHGGQHRLVLCRLWFTQFLALIVKRFHYTKRKLVVLLVQNLLPFAILALSLLIARSLQTVTDPPPLEFSQDLFFRKAEHNYMFVGGHDSNSTHDYMDTLYRPCGIGASTLGSSFDHTSQCYYGNATSPCTDYPQLQEVCTCKDNCSDWVPFPYPTSPPQCYNGDNNKTRIQDITTTFDPNDTELSYETLTTYLLRSKNFFIEERYGGLSFGHFRNEVAPIVDELNEGSPSAGPFLASHSVAKVWYSLKWYHAMPTYLNIMNNAILRANLDPSKDPSLYGKVYY